MISEKLAQAPAQVFWTRIRNHS